MSDIDIKFLHKNAFSMLRTSEIKEKEYKVKDFNGDSKSFGKMGSFKLDLVDSDLNKKGFALCFFNEDGAIPDEIISDGFSGSAVYRERKSYKNESCAILVSNGSNSNTKALVSDSFEVIIRALNIGYAGNILYIPKGLGAKLVLPVLASTVDLVLEDKGLYRSYVQHECSKRACSPQSFINSGEEALKDFHDYLDKIFPGLNYDFRFAEYNKDGLVKKVLPVFDNFERILKKNDIAISYNEMTRNVEIDFLKMASSDLKSNGYLDDNSYAAKVNDIVSICLKSKMERDSVRELIQRASYSNTFHPVRTWIETKNWDGVDRISELLNTVKVSQKEAHLKPILIQKWLVSAVAGLYEEGGVSAEGTLIFKGRQALGKTSWIKSLVPQQIKSAFKEGALLDPNNKDLVHQSLNKWIVELGEIDSTLNRSDISALKAFLPKSHDEYRRPYAKEEISFSRRTVFFGSVNKTDILSDSTGNRRFWVLGAEEIDFNHGIDIQQLWAQVKCLYDAGSQWHLTLEEKKLLDLNNQDYMQSQSVDDLFFHTFYEETGELRNLKIVVKGKEVSAYDGVLSVHHILEAMGIKSDDKRKQGEIRTLLRDNLKAEEGRKAGYRGFILPVKINASGEALIEDTPEENTSFRDMQASSIIYEDLKIPHVSANRVLNRDSEGYRYNA